MDKQLILTLCGVYSLAFAMFHVFFWKLFKWKQNLKKISSANRGIMQIANLRLIYLFLFIAYLCFFQKNDMIGTSLGNIFLAGISIFWLGRTVEQFVFFPLNNFFINSLTILFVLGSILFALPLL